MSLDELETLRKRAVKAAAAQDLDQAISIFKEALNICSSDEEASVLLINISLLYHQKANWEKALNYADHAMQAWPGNVKAYFRKGAALTKLGMTAAACNSFSLGLQFVPGHRHLRSALSEAQALLRSEISIESAGDVCRHQPFHAIMTKAEDASAPERDERSAEVTRLLQDSRWLHQSSLKDKGWYESYEQGRSPSAHRMAEDAVDMRLYSILHVAPGAPLADLRLVCNVAFLCCDIKLTYENKKACRAAYRRLIIVAHPDKGGSVEAFERVQHAYETLSAAAQS